MPVEAFVYDRRAFTEWMIALQRHPLASFYDLPLHIPADHLPGTLWLLTGLGTLISWLGVGGERGIAGLTPQEAQPFLKALPILADLIGGVLIAGIVRRVAPERLRTRAALLAAAGWVLAPGAIFISAVWGQWDAISLVFMLGALWCALHGRRYAVAVPPLIALAMLMKPQFAILAPLLGLFVLIDAGVPAARRLAVGGVLAAGIVTLAGWPFHVALLPVEGWATYAERASFAANRFHGTTYGAVSLWLIPLGIHHPPNDSEAILGPLTAARIGWGLVAVSALAGLAVAHRHRWSAGGLIAGCAVTYLGFVLFATRMHERYLLPALALTLLLAAVRPALGTILPAAALSLAFFASVYLSYTSFAMDAALPLGRLRTGPVLSALGIAGVASFAVLLVSVWSPPAVVAVASRRSREHHAASSASGEAMAGGQPINAGD